MGFDAYSTAARFRDAVRAIVRDVLEYERPRIKYGIVTKINVSKRTCLVQFVGDTDTSVNEVPFGFIAPSAVGQKVRIDGPRGDRYIVDVMPGNVVLFDRVPVPDLSTPVPPYVPPVVVAPVDPTPTPTPQNPAPVVTSDPDPDDGTLASLAFNNHTAGGTALTLDWTVRNHRVVLNSGSCALTFSNPTDGGRYQVHLKQDGTGGRVVTWPANVVWAGGTAPALSSAPNARDVVTFIYDVVSDKYLATPTLAFAV